MSGFVRRVGELCSKGGFIYAAGFGATLGVALAGAAFATRVVKVYLFDEEYNRMISRQRYLEKQTLFFAHLQDKLKTQAMANALVAQFNPVDLRPVGSSIAPQPL
jgi:hypothetical protein